MSRSSQLQRNEDEEIDLSVFYKIRDPWDIVADAFDPPPLEGDGFKGWVPFPKQLLAAEKAQIADELLFGGAAGPGKDLSIHTKICTPTGWSTMGELKVGDQVFGGDGKPCNVVAVSEVFRHKCYKLTFDDGSEIVSGGGHQWLTLTEAERAAALRRSSEWKAKRRASRPSRAKPDTSPARLAALAVRQIEHAEKEQLGVPEPAIRTTRELARTCLTERGRQNHTIALTKALQLPEAILPMDPYSLGVWLGDGTSAQPAICFNLLDQENIKSIAYGVRSTQPQQGSVVVTFAGLGEDLRKINVLNNKHIPTIYLRASHKQRLALLRGLVDTDGYVDPKDGRVKFCNTNKRIAFGVYELAISLGLKAVINEGRATLYGKDCGPKWRVFWTSSVLTTTLPRRAELLRKTSRPWITSHRYLRSVEPVKTVATKCIQVDSFDHTYLCGESMIPTHNSELLMEYGIREMEKYSGNRGIIFRRVLPSLKRSIMPRLKMKLIPTGRAIWNASDKTFTFPNLSIFELGSVQFADDVLDYQGSEYGWMGFEEVTEFLPIQYESLLSRCRTPATASDGVRPHIMATANPGGPNHAYYKRRFVKPLLEDLPDPEDPNGINPVDDPYSFIDLPSGVTTIPPMTIWRPAPKVGVHTPEHPPLLRCFVPATHKDNPMLLKRTPNYLSLLREQSNRGIRKAMEEGDWDAIEQVEGALWNAIDLDEGRVNPKKFRSMLESMHVYRVVSIDPSSGKKDAFAVSVQCRDIVSGQIYVEDCFFLEGKSTRTMAEFAIKIYNDTKADVLVVEKNHGHDWMLDTFKGIDPYINLKDVWASKGKFTRAEPVAVLFEKDLNGDLPFRARMVGNHPKLEEELTGHSFNSTNPNAGDSPDGLDALVWGISYLIDNTSAAIQHANSYGDKRLRGRR